MFTGSSWQSCIIFRHTLKPSAISYICFPIFFQAAEYWISRVPYLPHWDNVAIMISLICCIIRPNISLMRYIRLFGSSCFVVDSKGHSMINFARHSRKVKVVLSHILLVFCHENLLVFWIGITIHKNRKDRAYQLALAGNGTPNSIILKNKNSAH